MHIRADGRGELNSSIIILRGGGGGEGLKIYGGKSGENSTGNSSIILRGGGAPFKMWFLC